MYAPLNTIGAPQVDSGLPAGTVQQFTLGTRIFATDPVFGGGEFVYAKNTGIAIPNGTLVQFTAAGLVAANAITANTGAPLAVVPTTFPVGSVTPTYGWVQVSGIAPVTYSVAATVGRLFVGTAGNATPTLAAGLQILNAVCLTAATGTITKQASTQNGSTRIQLTDTSGLWVGMAASGTGIAASVISSINSDNSVTLSVAATAAGTVTATFTYTGYGLCKIERPFVQGNIT